MEPRFSLRSLLGAVTFFAIAVAALMQPWRSWSAALVLTGVLLLLLISIPAGIYARGRSRAFYSGFAIVGWGYFLLAYSPWLEQSIGRQLLAAPIAESVCFSTTGSLGDVQAFLKVTHALFMFAAAYGGGLAASRCYCEAAEQSAVESRNRTGLVTRRDDAALRSNELSLRKTS